MCRGQDRTQLSPLFSQGTSSVNLELIRWLYRLALELLGSAWSCSHSAACLAFYVDPGDPDSGSRVGTASTSPAVVFSAPNLFLTLILFIQFISKTGYFPLLNILFSPHPPSPDFCTTHSVVFGFQPCFLRTQTRPLMGISPERRFFCLELSSTSLCN